MRILVVEDDENSRELQHAMLEGTGHEVISAQHGREALDYLRTHPVDLVISDILMPQMDGFELCRRIRENPQLAHIPLVFYTATYTAPEERKLAMDVGADRYLVKPMDPEDFVKEIVAVLAERPGGKPERIEDFDDRHSAAMLRKLYEKAQQLEFTGDLLQTTVERYRHLVEAMHKHHFFYVYGHTGELKYVSPSSVRLLGCADDETLREAMTRIAGGPFVPGSPPRESIPPSCATETVFYEVPLTCADGGVRYFEVTETPILDAKRETIEVQGIAHDITDRRQMEEQQRTLRAQLHQAQKMEMIGNMASGLAHDFNNMLTVVMGNAELLELSVREQPEAAMEPIQEILLAGQRAGQLIRQMLTLATRNEENRQPAVMDKIVCEAVNLTRAALPRRISLRHACDREPLYAMVCDTHMVQVLMNLCLNASHAIGDQAGEILVALERFEGVPANAEGILPRGTYARLRVQDNGCGMSREEMEHIFEPYYSTRKERQGCGLGLAMVQSIVRAHGGHIHTVSQPGQGSTFSIYLPVCPPDAPPLYADMQPGQGMARRILLFSDQASSAELIHDMLRLQQVRVEVVREAQTALSLCREKQADFAACIVDCSSPDMAADVVARLRTADSALPLIVCAREFKTGWEAPARTSCLRKPFTLEAFDACLKPLIC